MGIAERKEKQKQEIRKMILDASIKLFVEEGVEHVSIRKIADLIEYSPTTVYLYFKDKNAIFYELHEMGFHKMAEYNASLWNIQNPLIRLHKMGENYLRFGLENPEFYDLMFIQKAPMQALEKMAGCQWESGDQAFGKLKECLQECMDRGLIAKGDIDAVAITFWAIVHGLVSLANRNRLQRMVNPEQMVPLMYQSLNWMLNSLDSSGEKRQG